jgi:hypothetical protein
MRIQKQKLPDDDNKEEKIMNKNSYFSAVQYE